MLIIDWAEEGFMHKGLVLRGEGMPEECVACCIAEQLIAEEWGLA
jgi:hypothetical protein